MRKAECGMWKEKGKRCRAQGIRRRAHKFWLIELIRLIG
jgi:hypothetical protein